MNNPRSTNCAILASLLCLLSACASVKPEYPELNNIEPVATSYIVQELEAFTDTSVSWPSALNNDGSIIVGSVQNPGVDNGVAVRWNATGDVTAMNTLGGRDSGASDISADGRTIVGSSTSSSSFWENAVKWNASGTITELASLGGDYYRDGAGYVSADGNVIVGVGTNNTFSKNRVLRWSASGQLTAFDQLPGSNEAKLFYVGLSEDGTTSIGFTQLTGADPYDYRAVKWNATGQVTDLGNLGGGSSVPEALSADGTVIVGYSMTSSENYHAVKWSGATHQITDLGTLGGTDSYARDVSANGSVIVGSSRDRANNERATKWTSAGQITNLGTLGGTNSRALDVSDDGSIILGWAQNNVGKYRAVIWDATGQITDLGTLGGDNAGLYDLKLSANGKVAIGSAQNSAGQYRGVLWRASENSKQNQAISFTSSPPTNATVGSSYTVSATASSGLTVSFSSATTGVCTLSGNTVRFVAAGTCTVRANQAGSAQYKPAPTVSQSITVGAGTTTPFNYTLNFNSLPAGQIITSVAKGRGITTTGPVTSNVSIQGLRKGKTGNVAMVQGTAKLLILSSNGTSQTPNPTGGTFTFGFQSFGTGKVTVKTLKVNSTMTTGGTVKVFNGSTLRKSVAIPRLGAGVSRVLTFNTTDANRAVVTLTGAGKIDDLIVSQ